MTNNRDDRDELAKVLAEHPRYAHLLNEEVRCANSGCWALIAEHCDELIQPDIDNAFAAHQAEAIAAAGWVRGRVEWGVYRHGWDDYVKMESREMAEEQARVDFSPSHPPFALARPFTLARRALTDWEQVD